ncbi:MAG: hypothetical protein JO001_22715 [Alphaproteobacteria bacterium]|nr:hypothetical protein [Alphaproteobacteria bacterium]
MRLLWQSARVWPLFAALALVLIVSGCAQRINDDEQQQHGFYGGLSGGMAR